MPKEEFTKKTDDLSLLSSILENNNNEKPLKDTSPDLLDESSDYKSYQKIKNSQLAERSLKFIHDIVRVSSSSPENSKENIHKDITLSPETTTKDTLFVNESKAPNPTKERPGAKKPVENKDGLSAEDIKIKNAIYKDIEYWKEKLTREYKDEKMNKINKINLLELQSNPYKWLQKKLENQQNKAKEELKDSDNIDDEQKEKLQFQLSKTEESIKNLKEAGVRNIPLKIGSDFTPLSIKLDRGLQFNITKHTEEINKAMGIISSGYSIEDVIQRANKRLLVVKTADGKIVEIPMQKVYELSKSEPKNPEAIIKKIRKGDIFEITQNGKDTLYNIVDKTNDTITYTINNIRGTSTTEQLAKLLSQEGVSAKNLTLEKTTATPKKPVETKKGDIGEVEKNVTVKTEPKVISDESTNKAAQENKQSKEDLEVKLQNEELEKLLNEISEGDVIKTISKEGKDDPFIINNIKEGNITFTQIATGKSDVLPVNQFNDVFLNHFGAKEIIKAKKDKESELESIPKLENRPTTETEVPGKNEILKEEIKTEPVAVDPEILQVQFQKEYNDEVVEIRERYAQEKKALIEEYQILLKKELAFTVKALEEFRNKNQKKITTNKVIFENPKSSNTRKMPSEIRTTSDEFIKLYNLVPDIANNKKISAEQKIAEAYHTAKVRGDNTQLVKAVEEAIGFEK